MNLMLRGSKPFLHTPQTPLVLTSVKVQNDPSTFTAYNNEPIYI